MKKKIVLFLTLSLCILSLVGCNSETTNTKKEKNQEITTTINKNINSTKENPTEENDESKEKAKKIADMFTKSTEKMKDRIKEMGNSTEEKIEVSQKEEKPTNEVESKTEQPTKVEEPISSEESTKIEDPIPTEEPKKEDDPTPIEEPEIIEILPIKPIIDDPIIDPSDPTTPIPIPEPTNPPAPYGHEDNIYEETNYNINISKNINNLNNDIFNKQVNKNENIIYSPYSLYVALLGLSNGSYVNNEARQELLEVLDIQKDASYKNIGGQYKIFNEVSTKPSSDYKFVVANSVWVDDSIGNNVGEFTGYLKNYFNSETYIKDIQNAATAKMMNEWVSGKTNGLINKVVDTIPQDALTYLINSVYFKGSWVNDFEERATEKKDFHGTNGTTQVDMMHKSFDKENFYQDEKLTSVELDYRGRKFSMRIFIPTDKNQYIGDIIKDYDITNIPYEIVRTNIELPKWDIEYTLPTNNIFNSMGLTKIFKKTPNTFELINERAYVSNILHKAKITVDEEGTEAAAVTVIEMVGTSYDPNPVIKDFIVDCPFIYTIIDNETNTIVFYGLNNNL